MNKKKKITILVCTLFMVFSLGACGKTKEDAAVVTQQESSLQIESMDEETTSEESTTFNNGEEDDIELKDTIEIDFTYDYTEDIKADVAYVVSNSSSLQEELKNIDTITQKYTLLAESAQTQGEINVASQWLYVIWDTELNNLWSRFSSLANQDTKEMVLEEQRNWIAMKEEVTLMSLGSQEENGSMYPMLVNSLWEEKTKNRAYFIANKLAQIEGESFAMPEASTKYGLFVDNQGTDAVYSSLITQQSWEGEDEAIISVYRLGEIEGSFIDNGNGNLDFTSDDGSIKGTIQINGWNVTQMFQAIIEDRNAPKVEKSIDGYSGFLFYDDNGMPLVAMHWQHRFNHMVGRYNDIYRVQLPNITPHVCRHTYCSNMAKSGMNPKTLQYVMEHSDISVTINVYTNIGFDDAEEELKRMEEFRKAQAEVEQKKEKPMSQKMFKVA